MGGGRIWPFPNNSSTLWRCIEFPSGRSGYLVRITRSAHIGTKPIPGQVKVLIYYGLPHFPAFWRALVFRYPSTSTTRYVPSLLRRRTLESYRTTSKERPVALVNEPNIRIRGKPNVCRSVRLGKLLYSAGLRSAIPTWDNNFDIMVIHSTKLCEVVAGRTASPSGRAVVLTKSMIHFKTPIRITQVEVKFHTSELSYSVSILALRAHPPPNGPILSSEIAARPPVVYIWINAPHSRFPQYQTSPRKAVRRLKRQEETCVLWGLAAVLCIFGCPDSFTPSLSVLFLVYFSEETHVYHTPPPPVQNGAAPKSVVILKLGRGATVSIQIYWKLTRS